MPQKRLPKYSRTDESKEKFANTRVTEIDLHIVANLAHYRILPTSILVKLVPGSEAAIRRHLKKLYHLRILDRFHIPRPAGRNPGEFIYVIYSTAALDWLLEHEWSERGDLDYEQARYNRERPYSDLNDPTKAEEVQGRLLHVSHELMISRLHACLELACRQSGGDVELIDWRQGTETNQQVFVPKVVYDKQRDLWGETTATERLSHRPDAFFTLRFPKREGDLQEVSFFYEADRKTTNTTRFNEKLRAHFHYVVKQRRHQEHYGVQRIRAVLVETITAHWAESLREAARHPLVSGSKPSPLFWFTTSTLFTQGPNPEAEDLETEAHFFLDNPGIIFARIWATPADDQLHSLLDA
jgi:hypothetical protein